MLNVVELSSSGASSVSIIRAPKVEILTQDISKGKSYHVLYVPETCDKFFVFSMKCWNTKEETKEGTTLRNHSFCPNIKKQNWWWTTDKRVENGIKRMWSLFCFEKRYWTTSCRISNHVLFGWMGLNLFNWAIGVVVKGWLLTKGHQNRAPETAQCRQACGWDWAILG